MIKNILICLYALTISYCFQFKAAKVNCNICTIGSTDDYTIQLLRSVASTNLLPTDWNIQAVPAGSSIVINFPTQFQISGTETCAYVQINYNIISAFSCSSNPSNKSITMTNAIPTNIFIQNVKVIVSGVKNPSPAITTSPFVGHIGIDVSANDSSATVTLNPGSFSTITARFDPTTVNTTGSLIIKAILSNDLPANGSIVVYFPMDLLWLREINANHKLPLIPSMSCSPITNMKVSLTCQGSTTQATVKIPNAFAANLVAGAQISFSINNIFSPPTTEEINKITVSSFNDIYVSDQTQVTIAGLTPKSFNLNVTSSSALIVNTPVNLRFDFLLPDSISRVDSILITFPAGTTFTYSTFTCPALNLNSSAVSYNSTTRQLRFAQSTSSVVRNAGTNVSISILTYTTPSSARTAGPFVVSIINGNGIKYQGSNNIIIEPKTYSATLSTTNTTVNSLTSYSISFTMTDSITSSGYFIIKFPTQLTLPGTINIQITGTSINLAANSSYVNSTSLRIFNLNTSSSNIPPQNITIRINDLVQPSSVKNISPFNVLIYYSSANDLVAQANTSNVISTTPGSITTASVTPSSFITAAVSQYTFSFVLANGLNSNSFVLITIPANVSINTGGTCRLDSTPITCSASTSSINFTIPTAHSSGSRLNITYTTFKNPSSTRPTGTFNIMTYNSAGQNVDILSSNTSVILTMTTPSPLVSTSFSRQSNQNSFTTSYTFIFTQSQAIRQSSAVVTFTLPSSIQILQNYSCSSGSTTLTCTASNNTISITFTPVQQDSQIYNFTIANLKNPFSYKPTQSIVITTLTADRLYRYSTISSNLEVINSIPSSFKALTFEFTNQVLSESSDLILNITMDNAPSYLLIDFAASFSVSRASVIVCSSTDFVPLCTLLLNNATGLFQIKVESTSTIPANRSVSIKFSSLTNPSNIPNDFTWVSSYTSDNFLISQSKNTVKFTTYCNFPCRLCDAANRSLCTSCYSLNVTNSIYLHQNQCLSACPSGFLQSISSFTCLKCQQPCLSCQNTVNYCTTCNTSTQFKYLNRTATTSTCLSECPILMYADLTQIPVLCVDCVAPCSQCTTRTNCTTCIANYYLFQTQCLTSCPVNITVLINLTCVRCQSICATCSIVPENCTSCSAPTSLFNSTCLATCPGNLISISNICVACDSKCLTCSILTTNCTSCYVNSSEPFYYVGQCLSLCPNFFYPDTFKHCLQCSKLNIGCKNCSSPTVCLSCDPGFVLLNSNCLSTVPDGYLNISGVAVPCQGDCATCQVTLSNCTSCKTLNLFQNTCKSLCPAGTVALNRTCRPCTYPCSQCTNSTTICTKCASNSSLYLYNNSCIAASLCPAQTYPQNATLVCTNCTQPCNLCRSPTLCSSCINNYFYVNDTSTCQTSCPPLTVGINRICMACLSPCESCVNQTTKCTTCIPNYYYNRFNFECLTSCPTGQIANQSTMQCQKCQSPCKTCVNTTDTCLSCVLGTFLSINLCVNVCPAGQYGISSVCKVCQNNCSTCSSAVTCLSCQSPLVLYSSKCLQSCPDTHALISNDSVCISCQTVVPGCSNCSIDGECFSCFYPNIYFEGKCLSKCPDGYKYSNFSCVVNNQTDNLLKQSLSSFTFPIPFTILGCVIFIACCMSKLQNSNTYLVGVLYSLLGLVQTGCLAHLIYQYIILGPDLYLRINLYIIFAVAGYIYVLNILSFIVQTVFLTKYDSRFRQWLKSDNKCFFIFVTLTSVIINYKFKMILFSKLFKFQSMSALLQNLSRFRLFNIFSFFGILAEALGLYVCFVSMFQFTFDKLIYHAFLDVIIIFIINILLAILIVWKPDNFFHEETEQGFSINKKVKAGGDDFSKQAILCDQINHEESLHGPNEYSILARSPLRNVQQLSDQEQSTKNKIKVYFSSGKNDFDETSNPFRKSKKLDKKQKIFDQNIFGDERYSENAQNSAQYQSQSAGGSEPIQPNSPAKSPKKHATIVVGTNDDRIKTNQATQNQDIGKKISQRQRQLDIIKKQLQDQQQVRKKKRKSRKKLKKSIDYDLDVPNNQPQYQQVSIKESEPKMKTQQDSNMRTMQQYKNVQLNAQNKQTHVQQDFKDIPKQTINSWMQLRIAEQNRKLPVFNKNLQNDKTISLPQSQAQSLQSDYQLLQRQFNKQKLAQQQNLANVESDLIQMKKQKQKQQIEKQKNELKAAKNTNNQKYQYQQQRSKDFSNLQIQNNSIEYISKKMNSNNISNQITKQYGDSHRTRNKNSFSYNQQKINQEVQQSSSQILKQQNKFSFEQSNKDFDQRAGTRLNFQNLHKKQDQKDEKDDQLQDSEKQDQKQRINDRPFSAARKNKLKNTQALLQILAKSQRDRMNSRGSGGRKISQEDQKRISFEGKNFKLSNIKKSQEQQQRSQQNQSRMYKAGLKQLSKQSQIGLNKKKTMNYPLNSLKKKSIEDSQLSSSIMQIGNSRSRSFNTGAPFRKFTSKDINSDNIDDLDLKQFDYQKNYQQLMNQRYNPLGSQRRHANYEMPKNTHSIYRRSNFVRGASQDIITSQQQPLDQYYKKQHRSIDKRDKREKDKKSLGKQKSFEQTKRIKELERIYLSRN